MLMAPFYVHKMMEIHHKKKPLITSLIFFNLKKIDKAYNNLKDST